MKSSNLLRTVVSLLLVSLLIACGKDQGMQPSQSSGSNGQIGIGRVEQGVQDDIVQVAQAAGIFNTLLVALTSAGLVETLKSTGPFTVFAPSDEAFAKLPASTLHALLNNKEELKKLLLYHVLAGKVAAETAITLTEARTVEGRNIAIKYMGGELFINASKVVQADIEAKNGIIHVIDQVLIPPSNLIDTLVQAGQFNTLLAAIEAAGLKEILANEGPFTVFAPTDAAFAKIPAADLQALIDKPHELRKVLLYHVVEGKVSATEAKSLFQARTLSFSYIHFREINNELFVNDSKVIAADVNASNGIAHVIDAVLFPTN